jgi:hypothetical protein
MTEKYVGAGNLCLEKADPSSYLFFKGKLLNIKFNIY